MDNKLKVVLKNLRERILRHKRNKYLGELINRLGNNTTIICSNCFGGRIIQDIGMQYNSPTVGLFFVYPDYVEFIRKLRYYLTEAKITFPNKSRYENYNQLRIKRNNYPIGLIDDKIEIHFLHYHSSEEALVKWVRRVKRINWDKLLVIGMDQNLCSESDIRDFDRLPIRNKVFFTHRPIKGECIVTINEFKDAGQVGDPYKKGHIFYKYFVEYLRKNPRLLDR